MSCWLRAAGAAMQAAEGPALAGGTCTVAYSPNAKKGAFFAALTDVLAGRGIRMHPLRPDGGLVGTDARPVLVLHKLTDDIAGAADSAEAAARLAAVHALTDADPAVVVLDPLPAVECLRDRRTMAAAVENLPALYPAEPACGGAGQGSGGGAAPGVAGVRVRMPYTAEVSEADILQAAPPPAGLPHGQPLVVKSAAACSTPEAHYMAVVESWEQLAALHPAAKDGAVCPVFPAIVQPYIPHGGIVHKVYVVGSSPAHGEDRAQRVASRYYAVRKPSLRLTPAIMAAKELRGGGCGDVEPTDRLLLLLFDALHPSRTPAGAALFQPVQAANAGAGAGAGTGAADADATAAVPAVEAAPPEVLPPAWLIEALNRELQRLLGLTLFGYDLVREEATGDYWILDINYFPSYVGCEGVVDAVADTIEGHLALQAHAPPAR